MAFDDERFLLGCQERKKIVGDWEVGKISRSCGEIRHSLFTGTQTSEYTAGRHPSECWHT